MNAIMVVPRGVLYFAVHAPCGKGWSGMRNTPDVGIVIDRAMAHVLDCSACAQSDEIREPRLPEAGGAPYDHDDPGCRCYDCRPGLHED